MSGWIAAGIAAAGLLGSYLQQQGQSAANDQNKDLTVDNRRWMEEMSNTAVRRAKYDLESAGLNPMLAAGVQASTPTPPTAQMQNEAEGWGNTAKNVGDAAAAYQSNRQVNLQQQKQSSEISLMDSQKRQADANAAKANMETAVIQKDIPEADIKNRVYRQIRKNFDEANEVNAGAKRQQNIDLKSFRERTYQKLNQQRSKP